jgi:hypothetical protein
VEEGDHPLQAMKPQTKTAIAGMEGRMRRINFIGDRG